MRIKTTNRQTEILNSAIPTWIVKWEKMYSIFSSIYTEEVYQAFISKEEAEKLASSLRQAFQLIGTTTHTTVTVYLSKTGL